MGIEAVFFAVALLAVAVSRGSYKKLLSTKIVHWWTLIPVLVGHLLISFAPIDKAQYDTIGLGLLLMTYIFLFGFCVANLDLKGMWIVLVGIACNAMVIGLNKGMPVTNSGGYVAKETIKHQPATSSDLLPWLSDIIPINFASIAISIGDIIFGVGLIVVCVFASRKEKVSTELELNTDEMIETDFEVAVIELAGEEADEVQDEIIVLSDEIQDAQVVLEDETVDVVEAEVAEVAEVDEPEVAEVAEVIEPARVEAPTVMMTSSRGPGGRKSSEARTAKAEKLAHKRKHKKWQKTHGLAALPSKEELGFDEASMEIVEVAK